MEIEIKKGKRKIKIPVVKTGFFRRGIGLMFRNKGTKNLLFEFTRDIRIAITSWFVFFPFLIIWLDSKNTVVEFKIVEPFTFKLTPKKKFRKFIEIPINAKNMEKIDFFVGKRRKI